MEKYLTLEQCYFHENKRTSNQPKRAVFILMSNVPSKSLLSVRGMKGRVSNGGYSNLGTRGKDFQKLMFSKKEKEF